jgi:hypothetical protein
VKVFARVFPKRLPMPRSCQADALEIEALAKRRLADEYDAAQERGEVIGRKGGGSTLPSLKGVTSADVGLTYKEIHEARTIRDVEKPRSGAGKVNFKLRWSVEF